MAAKPTAPGSAADEDLLRLQRTTVLCYLHETNPDNGLVRDKPDPADPCSTPTIDRGTDCRGPTP